MKRLWLTLASLVFILFFDLLWESSGSRTRALVFWGIVPTVVALCVIVVSTRSIVRGFGAAQVLLGVPTILLSIVSIWTLERIFIERGWPTYLPHLAIASTIPIAAIQSYLARGRDRRRA